MALSNVKKNLKKKAEEARRNSGAVAKLKTAAAQTAKTPKYYSGKNAAGTGAGRKPSASVTTGTRGKIPKNSKPVSNGAVSNVKKRVTYQAKKTSYYSGKNASGTGIGMKRTAPVVTGKSGKVKDNQRPLYYRSRDNAQPVRDNPMKRKSDFTNVKNLLQEQRGIAQNTLYRSKDDGTMRKRYGNTPTAYDYSWQTKQQDRKSKGNQRALEQYAQAKSGDMEQAIRDYYEPHNASWRNESWKKLRFDYANKKIYLGDHIMTQEEADRLFPFGSSNPEDRRLLEEAGYQIHSFWPQTVQDASEERRRALGIGERRGSASDLGKVEDPDLTRILGYQEDWAKAKEAGNKEAMANAHEKAEAIRAKYGYSGGDAGDQTIRGDVSMDEYKQLNHEGDAALSMARLKLSRAVTEEEKAKAEQEIQAILSDPEYQADEANRLKLLTSSAVKGGIGGTLHMLEGIGLGAENIARGNAMPQWIEMAAEIPDLEAELKTIDEAIATWGYDPMHRDRDEIEKRLKRARAAEAEIERAKTDKRSDFYVPPDPGKVWSPGTTTPTRWEKMIQEGQNEYQRATEGWNAAQKFGADLYANAIQMAPTTLAALIPGAQGTALGTIGQIARGASLASMSLSAGGQRMYELQQRGVPQAEAERGGLAAAGIEYFTEKLPMEYLHSIATGSKRAGIEALKTAGISGAIEGTEEGLSYAGNAAYSYLMGYREDAFSASEMARDMLAGGIMGGFHAGVGVAMNHAINHFIGQGDTQAPKWLLEQADEIDRLLQESEDYKTLAAQGVLSEQEHVDIQDTLRSDLETKLQQIQGVMSQIKNFKSMTQEETEQLRSVLGTDQESFSRQDMSNLARLTLSGQMKANRMMENRGETTAERQAREQAEMEARARNLVSLGRTVIDNSTGPVTEAPRTLEEAAEMKTADQVPTDIPPVTYERSRFPMTSVIGSLIDSHRETQARKARDEQVAAERAAAQETQTQEVRTPQVPQTQAQTPQARSLTNSADMARSSDPVIRTAAMLGVNGGKAIQRAALSVTGNESRLMFSRGFVQVYNQALSGKTNIRRPYVMNETQFNIAVDSATRDRKAGLSREILNSQKAAGYNRNAGLDMSDAYVKGLDHQVVKLMDKVAKDLGVRVQFVEEGSLIVGDSAASVDGGKQTANADISGNVVRIEKNNPNPVLALIGHELTHRMQDVSPEAYRAFRDYVMQIPGQAEIVQSTMEAYRRRGANINMEGAMDEVAANFAGNLFNSSAELQRFIRENRQNRTLLQRILDVFRDIAAKLTGRERAQADEAVRLLEDALGAASEAVEKLGSDLQAARNVGVEIDADTESASPSRWSLGSWNRSDYMTDRDAAAKALAKQLKVSQKKAKDFIDAVNSVAKMIADDRAMLDYIASPGRSAFVSNTEYGGSIDFSTICKKRRLFTGTIDAIQRAMPDRVLTADEMLKIRAEMKRRGYEVGCGLCYVEGSRVKIGKYTKEFLDGLKAEGAEYVPTLAEMNTVEGQEEIRLNHPETYEKYVKFMNKLAQRKPKLFQMATEYKREILDAFEGKEETVKEKNKNGGLRLQSFSDFEIIHLIDCMQVIMDMSRVGLAGQAYTKQPEFAWALGETGLKINLSLIAKGVDENGRLIFDDVEGMPINDAMALRDRYSKNVGTVIVVFNDQQLLAALADDRIDFVLPFHRSQWNKKQYDVLGLPQGTKDYTLQQNEKYILPVRHQNRNGKWVKERPANYMPNEYWNFRKSGKWNAEQYLKMCAENNRRPKFFKLLVNNGDGSYSLQPDGSTDGYWKLLIDFKMYDNEGVGSPQKPVRPEFNMEEAERMLREYAGGHESFPVAQDVVDEFVGGTRFSISTQTDAITMDDVMNLRSIGRKSVNAFTSEEIQKAVPWARKFWQEMGVKSPFFRAWFGDWRSESTDPISLPRIDMAATPSSGNAVNADTERKMSWDTNAARESVLNASRENKDDIQIIASNMDEIVKCAILLDTEVSQPSSKRKMPGTAFMHSFYTVAPLGNRQILVKLFAEEAYSAKQDEVFTRAYSIKHIEKVADLDYGVHPAKGLSSSQSATINSVADLFALVKQSDPVFKPNPASKVVNADGSPKVVYHQTGKEFWTFDNSNPVAGKTDSETPSGFFFKDNDHDIGIGGARQVAAYLDMKKPLHFRTREAANAWYSKNIDGYKDLQEEMKAAVKPLLAQMDQLERDMFSEETDEEMYEALDQKWNGILADLTKVEDSYRGRLHDMLNRYFLDNDSGYDGIILDYDGHRYVDGKRENVKSYIVFDRTQIKSATHNVGTFDRGNPDTRYSIGTGGFDQAKLMRENQLLRDRVEYWKGQTKRSDRTKADPKEVKKLAKKLAGDFSTTMDTAEIAGQLQAIYDGLGKDWTYDQAYEAAHSLAREMVEQASETDGYLYYEYEPLREHFRKTPLVLSPSDRAGITDYNDWRKAQMGRLRIQHGDQSNVDQVYQELSHMWPEFFDEERDVSSLDQLERIAEVMDGIYTREEQNPFGDDLEGPAGYLAAEIMERYWDMPNVKRTYADRAEARLGREVTRRLDMQEKYQEKLQQVREDRDKKLKQKSEEYLGKKRLQSQRYKERERRAQIMRHARELSKKLLKPSDKQHIPQQLREAVAAVLDSVNLSSKNFKDTNRTRAFQELRLAYQEVIQQGESLVIDPDLMDNISEVEAMRDTPIAEMNLSQLETIWKTIRAVEASITTANKAFGQQRFATIFEAADGLRQAMQSRRDRGDYRGPAGAFDKLLNSGMLTPESYFHRMGETGQDIFRMLRNAQDKHIGIMQEAQGYTEKIVGKTKVRKWEKEVHTFDFEGQKVQLTTAQIMSLYELMKRKQAVDHITVGGIKPEGIEKGIRSKTPSEPYRLTLDQISEIVDSLTEEQMAMADALQKYMGGRLSELGNEASMAVYGYRKFTEKHYFPIKVDKNQTVTDQTKEAQAATIAGRGFTKSTTPKANNALIVRNIFDVYADHVTDMATYSSWLEAMENLQRIYNFTFRDADNNRTGTTKGYLERAFGRNGLSYWEKLTEDLNNGVHGTNDNPFNSLIGNYKASAIGANIRVFVQQPTAILRALDDINPVDFLAGLGRARPTTWAKVKKYAPIAVWKDWGYFDADTGRQMKSILFGDDSALAKVNNGLMAPAGMMDSLGWSHIWNALEAETRRTRKDLKPRTDAFYQAVAARFNAVIDHSQVVDGILQRSQVMRSPDALTKMATSFMAEPTKVYNMFTTAVYDLKHSQDPKARTQAMKVLGRTTFALIASFFANAAAQSLVDALRDDDKDEEYWEKFFQAFYGLNGDEETTGEKVRNAVLEGNLGASFNPATYIPWAKDIVSLAQGFKVSRMDMDSISKFVQEIGSTWKAFHGDGKITLRNALSRLTAEGARLLGIPASNIKRDVLAIYSTAMNSQKNYLGQFELQKWLYRMDNTNNQTDFVKIAYAAQQAGDTVAYEKIKAELVDVLGQEKFDEKMKNLGKKELEAGGDHAEEFNRVYGTYETQMAGNPLYSEMPAEEKAKVEASLKQYASDQVMYDASSGEITSNDTEMAAIKEAEAAGIDPVTYKSFRVYYNGLASDKDENGKDIPGQTKQDKTIRAIEELELSNEQSSYLYHTCYSSDANNPWA